MKTLILGVGNRILRDDGIGPAVVEELQQTCFLPDVHFESTNLAGMPLLDIITGHDALIVIDSIRSGRPPGDVRWLDISTIELTNDHLSSQHNIGILQAVQLGESLGIPVPGHVSVLAIEARDVTDFGEELSPEVRQAIPAAVAHVLQRLHELTESDLHPATGSSMSPSRSAGQREDTY